MAKNKVVNGNDSEGTGTYGSTLSAPRGANQANMDEVNKGFLFMNAFTVSLGFMQFGVGMNSYGTL